MRPPLLILFLPFLLGTVYSQDYETIELWPQGVPGQSEGKAPSLLSEDKGDGITRLRQVTNPTLRVYEANPDSKNGAAVIVCPGGGYHILAIDKEGYEIGEWLSEIGYTAFVLQYRVPKNRAGALQDVQRAVRCVRGMSEERGLSASKIGVLGFSAGGSLGARLCSRYREELYPSVDEWDRLSARPDFTALLYPAYLDQGPNESLTPELVITKKTPPTFLFVTADDRFVKSSLVMSSALSASKVPFELHVLPRGGHGYGMRPGNPAAEAWPQLCADWLKATVLN